MKTMTQLAIGYSLAIVLSCSSSVPAVGQESPATAAFKRLDKDGDGFLGLFIAADPDNTGVALDIARYESKIYWNTGEHGGKQNHRLHLTFTGRKDAELIGAPVELTAAGKKQDRWIHSNHSYKSGSALEAHFGLGTATKADVKVTLLSGETKIFPGIVAGKAHELGLAQP
jgi:hypothetical protein